MVGEWMIDPIKIPWFRRPGPSWSLVYLVRGGSRPNLTEGSLSAAMGCFVQGYLVDLGFNAIGEHTGAGHNRNIVMPFGGKSPDDRYIYLPLHASRLQNFGSLPASPPFRGKLRETGPPATTKTAITPFFLKKIVAILHLSKERGKDWLGLAFGLEQGDCRRGACCSDLRWKGGSNGGAARSYKKIERKETELPAIRPYLGVLDLVSYTHSSFRLELREMCFPMLNLLKLIDLKSSFYGWLTKWGFCYYGLSSGVLSRRSCQRSGHIWACWIRPFTPIRTLSFRLLRDFKLFRLNLFGYLFGDPGTERDSESPPRFTFSICDAMSGSDSSSSGKYRSSSELQSIGNTIIQASGASFLTYSSFTGILGTTEMTRHTSAGRKSTSPSSSVSPILSSDIKSASLMGCLTLGLLLEEFLFSRLQGASLADVLLRSRCLYLGQSFQVKHWLAERSPYLWPSSVASSVSLCRRGWHFHHQKGSPQLPSPIFLGSNHLHRQWSQPRVGVGIPVGDVAANRHHLHHHHIQLQYALPYIRPPYLWCRSALLVHLPYNPHLSNIFLPLPYLLSLPLLISGSLSDGATESPVVDLGRILLRLMGYDRSWILALEESTNDGISWRILQGVDRQDKCHHGFSFGPIFDDLDCWGWISGKPHRMSRPNPFLFLFPHHLFEALASKLIFLSTGTFQWWIPECAVRLSHPDVHRVVKNSLSLGGVLLTSVVSGRWNLFFVCPFSLTVLKTRNDGSSCNNGREVEATKLDGSSGIPSINDSVRQLDPGSLSQLNSHWGVL
ncbi:hypothetical protein M5K25_004527 [Dendrobium thyrsiflorum]|uniref:Uncharacterized protein n=1 Tax=Dendrobium thyrsiflorum TaxID=117978 RepID=A0ABD0VMT3_DENTH